MVVNPLALQQLAGISAPPPAAPVVAPVKPVHHWHVAPRKMVPQRILYSPPPLRPAPPPPAPVPVPMPVVAKPVVPVRLSFAAGSAALPQGTTAALKPWCATSGRIAVSAFAPADPNDPSAALRLSLSRALAVRDALVACGVSSTAILPRALGNTPGGGLDDVLIGSPTAP